jgi:adenine-specific DNA-methyltransferase
MRGFVRTPEAIVDSMVDRLFASNSPKQSSAVLDPGCGDGAFIEGIIRWCERQGTPVPRITGIESHPARADEARKKFAAFPSVTIAHRDFLVEDPSRYDYVIGNPPYVSILQISEEERNVYRERYESARGRFDLYILFFQQSIGMLTEGGRLVFITPEKYLYVKTCEALRRVLARNDVVEIALVNEDAFKGLVTYPTITTIDKNIPSRSTLFVNREGASRRIQFPSDGSSLLPLIQKRVNIKGAATLGDICLRVSCGIATGADDVFIRNARALPMALRGFGYPTISGRQLSQSRPMESSDVMLVPYDKNGELLPAEHLGALKSDLASHMAALTKRVCAKRKPWYAFHDSVPFADMLRPKLICKDIAKEPHFWLDREGTLVPRHSVYYIVPRDESMLDALFEYLSSDDARAWLTANCQRAANGFMRMQSSILRSLPVPESLVGKNNEKKHKRRSQERRAA